MVKKVLLVFNISKRLWEHFCWHGAYHKLPCALLPCKPSFPCAIWSSCCSLVKPVTFNYKWKANVSLHIPLLFSVFIFPSQVPSLKLRSCLGTVQWLRSKAAQCSQLVRSGSPFESPRVSVPRAACGCRAAVCQQERVPGSYLGRWGSSRLQVLHSPHFSDFLPGQTRVGFYSREDYSPAFGG